MINKNLNIIQGIRGPKPGPVRYEFPATIWLAGGGGGGAGASGFTGATGGAGSTIVSASLAITPNVTYEVEVGVGGIGGATNDNGTDGGASFFYAYTNNYDSPVTMSCEGGQRGLKGDFPGPNSGTGSVEYTTTTENFPGFTGGLTYVGSIGGQPATAMGGGAGAGGNGIDGGADFVKAGNGGTGISLPYIGQVAGGGGAGAGSDTVNTSGTGTFGGGNGGANQGAPGTDATALAAGGGGGGASAVTGGSGGDGGNGFAMVIFTGKIGTQYEEYDIEVTNATVDYTSGVTTILFETGSGTLRYTAPYPYVPKP